MDLIADTRARSSIFLPSAADALYSPDRRFHLVPANPVIKVTEWGESRLTAAELTIHQQKVGDVWPAVAILHMESLAQSSDHLLAHLEALTRHPLGRESLMEAVTRLDRDAAEPAQAPLIYTSTLFDAGLLETATREQALHLAASLQPFSSRPISSGDIARAKDSATRIPLSNDWDAVVYNRGVGYVMTNATPFRDSAFTYAETIYLDALALVLLQGHVIELLSIEVARADPEDFNAILALDRTATEFRARWWWPTMSHSIVVSAMVDSLRDELATAAAMNELGLSTRGLRESVQTRLASKVEASGRRSAAALGLLSIIGLPLGVALTIWQGFTTTVPSLAVAVVAAALLSLLLSLLPMSRGLWSDLWQQGGD